MTITAVAPVFDDNNIINIDNSSHLLHLFLGSLRTRSTLSTIKLTSDIDMENQKIDDSSFVLQNIIFDGNNKTISNLNLAKKFIVSIDKDSILKDTNFKNCNCINLIDTNDGIITNCSFKNASCSVSSLVNSNNNLITKCTFNEIKITNIEFSSLSNNNNIGVIAAKNNGTISSCTVNNVIIKANNSYSGGICGVLSKGTISSCSVENIKSITSENTICGAICGLVEYGTIEKCKIFTNTINKKIAIIIGKLLNNTQTTNINCITFRTNKDDIEDKVVDLKYDRKMENRNRASKITNTKPIETTTSIKTSLTKMISLLDTQTNHTMKNIYKYNSENKMSKWDYEGIIFDDTICLLELPKIIMKKIINDPDVDKIKQYLKKIIKTYAFLDVDIISEIIGNTLKITINDMPSTTTTGISGAEHFANQVEEVVYIYNTSNNVAIMDALNQAVVDPSDIVILGEEAEPEKKSTNLLINILIFTMIILIILVIILINTKTNLKL